MNTNLQTYKGKQRFEYFLQQLQTEVDKANLSENPALTLYQQNFRTPIFMLEGLTRLYKRIHNKKLFTKLNIEFKELEDQLGKIDYYNGFYQEFLTRKNIPVAIINYLKHEMDIQLAATNKMLIKKGWIGKNNKRLNKINAKLEKINWLNEQEDFGEVKAAYKKFIAGILKKYQDKEIQINNIEEDVHELRRELRWLSIYAQSLRGLIQLKPGTETPDFLQKYLTNEILTSPYNLMPHPGSLQNFIMLDSNYLYALSWLIAELGKLKDNGLRILVLKDALSALYHLKNSEAEQLAFPLCGDAQISISEILIQSKEIITRFFNENILQNLVLAEE